ncbi:hypothetical protein [Planomonospora sp. ID82291]|uniref:hypothetical protein n=1 Tax=Planomonospora sp. ID82291 TaxID=2738136 RepID=UPI0018C40090|nr:hypothetical protein [Planomonospora sp. ID82291]MBG0818326.1 hypothetical protein [Planomonospora sp. ID82291]
MGGQPGVAEAELAAHGLHPVSIAHGDAQDAQAAHLIYEWVPQLAEETGPVHARVGGNDYTTVVFATAEAAATFTAAARAAAPTWWKITPTAQPVWR